VTKIETLIKKRILEELKDQGNISNFHGVDLTKSLVEPYRETFEVAFEEGETIELYVVLKERPNSNEGYHIACDPETWQFALTIGGNENRRIFLGFYGSFLDTFRGM
jgi:hypothetical protein